MPPDFSVCCYNNWDLKSETHPSRIVLARVQVCSAILRPTSKVENP